MRVADAKKLLTDAGISASTIQRAKQRLRIRSVRERDEQGKTIGGRGSSRATSAKRTKASHDDPPSQTLTVALCES
jgi:hypothetical protein